MQQDNAVQPKKFVRDHRVGHERFATFPAYRELPIAQPDVSDEYQRAAVLAIRAGRPVPLPETVEQHAVYVDLFHPWADPERTGWKPKGT